MNCTSEYMTTQIIMSGLQTKDFISCIEQFCVSSGVGLLRTQMYSDLRVGCICGYWWPVVVMDCIPFVSTTHNSPSSK